MIKLIAGRLNGLITSNYWLDEGIYAKVGDYVIVENKRGYDIVEVTATLETDEEHIGLLTGNKINKKVLLRIPKESLRGE